MKKIFDIIPAWIVAIVAVMLVSACSESAAVGPEEPEGSDGSLSMGLILSVGDVAATEGSRATPAGDYDRGSGYENFIDIPNHDFRVLFFDTQNKYITEFKVNGIVAVEDYWSSKFYQILGEVEKLDMGANANNFKVVVLANWSHYLSKDEKGEPVYPELIPGTTTIDGLCKSIYDFSTPFMPTAETPIPLFGVKSYSNVKFDLNNFAGLGTLHLLRAMAKIEVQCTSLGWTLEEVVLSRYNKSGLMAPTGVTEESHYVKNDYNGDYVDHVSIPENVVSGTDLSFKFDTNRNVFLLYVPEFSNTDDKGNPRADKARIKVSFKENSKIYSFDFDTYVNGNPIDKPFDIRRNYFYKFTIDKHPDMVVVDVTPYNSVVLKPGFGFDRDPITGEIIPPIFQD